MYTNDKTFIFLLSIISIIITVSKAQNFWKTHEVVTKPPDPRTRIIWCTISQAEQQKCLNFAMANERDRVHVGYDQVQIECKQSENKDSCMQLLDEEKATMTTLDAGSIFVGGRYHSLVPIAQEVLDEEHLFYYSVAVVKKGTLDDVVSLSGLRGKKACFPGVEAFAGWVVPIYTLMKEGGMEIIDCNNHVKSASNFFGPSCSVNVLTDKFNPIGDNSDKLCKLCIGKIPGGRCTDTDPYAGYEGAFRCLLEAGEVAFLKHNTVPELIAGMEFAALSIDTFELLCKDGTRRPIKDYLNCNWGEVPSDAVVVSSAVPFEKRIKYQQFLTKFAEIYHKTNNTTNANRNAFGNNQPNEYDRQQPEFDQFGNRVNRYKRQSFGNPSSQDDTNRFSNNPYNNDNSNPYTNNQYNPYANNNNNPYKNNDNLQNSNPYGQDNNRYQESSTGQNFDPFAKDPYSINRDQYGVNIDPYVTDSKYNKNTDPIYTNVDAFGNNLNDTFHPRDNTTYYEVFNIFESTPKYGQHGNLMFQDAAKSIIAVPENQQTYTTFLGPSLNIIMGVRDCPVNRMVLCVTSDAEKNKCAKMRTALKAQLLKPEMECYKGHSQIHCMQAIRAGTADVTVLDASDVYTAGLNYDLVPFISEVYNLNEPEYYVVAVAKESDDSTDITYLKNKNTCHGGINTAAGWVYPMALLINNGWIRPYGCNSIRAAAEYFTKSCIPGAISTEYNTGVPYDNMCDLCHGASYRYCRRDASEDYYGHTGAFRCLVEGGGHVAFVKHTTVTENTGGKKKEWWTRDNLNDDYELLCPDGTRAEINEYVKCNLGKVKANAIVTRGGYGYDETHIKAFINLFMYAQTFYGRKTTDEFSFSMFSSPLPYSDLIFQDATTQLKIIEPSMRNYADYLGGDFLRARRIVDCHAGAETFLASVLLVILPTLLILV